MAAGSADELLPMRTFTSSSRASTRSSSCRTPSVPPALPTFSAGSRPWACERRKASCLGVSEGGGVAMGQSLLGGFQGGLELGPAGLDLLLERGVLAAALR